MTRTLLCFGDSNTHGTMPMATLERHRRALAATTRWTGPVAQLLARLARDRGRPAGPHHRARRPGRRRRIATGLPFCPRSSKATAPIDAVILMLGTNDLKGRFSVNADRYRAVAGKAGPRHPRLARRAGADRAGVLLVAPPPILEVGSPGRDLLGRRGEVAATLARAIAAVGRARRGAVSRCRAPDRGLAHRRHPLRRGRTGHPRPGLRRRPFSDHFG